MNQSMPSELPAKCPYCENGCDKCQGGFFPVTIPWDEALYTQKCQNPECGFENGLCFGEPPKIELYPCVQCGHPDVQWLLLREKESAPVVLGPAKWPELQWAAKDAGGQWCLFVGAPTYSQGTWLADGPCISADATDWTPPVEIADRLPEKSLVKLRHTCRWRKPEGGGPEASYLTECQDFGLDQAVDYCPRCGREVEYVESQK